MVRAFEVEDDDTFKKFSHKKDITRDLYYNVYCGDVDDMIQMLPKKEYTTRSCSEMEGSRIPLLDSFHNCVILGNIYKLDTPVSHVLQPI